MLSDDELNAALQTDPAAILALMSGEMTVGEFKLALCRLSRAVERAAYEHAARVCEANENRIVKTHPVRIEIDPDSMMARKCAAAIRALGGNDGH